MPWKLEFFEHRPTNPKIGDCWYNRHLTEGEHKDWYLEHELSIEYKQTWLGKRPPIEVCFPGCNGMNWFCIDRAASGSEHGWIVMGELPNISASPSINMIGVYHGWIRDGVITDDCEGRKYSD